MKIAFAIRMITSFSLISIFGPPLAFASGDLCPPGLSQEGSRCVVRDGDLRQPGQTIFGIMYHTWHCPYSEARGTVNDVSKTLKHGLPWASFGDWYWKSEPVDGYYCLADRADVLRKHAIQLRDAGIQFIYIDASNHPSSNPAFADRPQQMVIEPLRALLKVWSEVPGAPRVVPFAPLTKTTDPMVPAMFKEIEVYPSMALIRDGKPFFLLVDQPALPVDDELLQQVSQKYSHRRIWQPNAPGFRPESWSFMTWCKNPQGFKSSQGEASCDQAITGNGEQLSISPALNAYIFSQPDQATGRFEGKTFAKQFEVLNKNPTVPFATFSEWNSWVAIHFCKKKGGSGELTSNPAECEPGSHEFVDTYTDELSRDMEPTRSQGDRYYRQMKSCVAKFRRGQDCRADSADEIGSMVMGSTLRESVERACTYPKDNQISNNAKGEIQGFMDGLVEREGRVVLRGWSCRAETEGSVKVHLYAGGAAGRGGIFIGEFQANLPAEEGIHDVCRTKKGTPHRYEIDVTDLMGTYSGRALYVHGINEESHRNFFLNESGKCVVPWREKINGGEVASGVSLASPEGTPDGGVPVAQESLVAPVESAPLPKMPPESGPKSEPMASSVVEVRADPPRGPAGLEDKVTEPVSEAKQEAQRIATASLPGVASPAEKPMKELEPLPLPVEPKAQDPEPVSLPEQEISLMESCAGEGSSNIPGIRRNEIVGYVDRIFLRGGKVLVNGWTCIVGASKATSLHLYLDGPAGHGGSLEGGYSTTIEAEPAVNQICQNGSGTPNRFEIDISHLVGESSGRRIFIHGLNPNTFRNYFLFDSGRCAVPSREMVRRNFR